MRFRRKVVLYLKEMVGENTLSISQILQKMALSLLDPILLIFVGSAHALLIEVIIQFLKLDVDLFIVGRLVK
jgi:hypothetical protein